MTDRIVATTTNTTTTIIIVIDINRTRNVALNAIIAISHSELPAELVVRLLHVALFVMYTY